nr:CPBP family intramembrane glutamic endopeptidase [Akkermansia muciniphila]
MLQRRHRRPSGGGTYFPRLSVPDHEKIHGRLVCLITTSLLFGIIHVSLVPFIPLAIFGAVLVLLYEYTGSIWTPIIAHCIFNTATLINILYPGILLPYGT